MPKTKKEIEIMAEGGKKLAKIKKSLTEKINEGVNAQEIEELAEILIKETGGKASFKMVPRYKWTTCVNVNEGVVHGIPKKETVFKKGDVVSVDIGLFYKGFHTDTSISVGIKPNSETEDFLKTGKLALDNAIDKAQVNNKIFDISKAIQNTIENAGLVPIRALVGHGIGRSLHETPQIPCFVEGDKDDSPTIPEGAVLAIEVMYTLKKPDVKVSADGWTILTRDGKITGLFEETVAITAGGPLVLTKND